MQARLITYAQQAANDCLMTLDVLEDRLLKIINSTAGARDPKDENDRKRRGAFSLGGDVLLFFPFYISVILYLQGLNRQRP